MTTLEEAWNWYQGTKKLLRIVRRLGDRYWDDLPWEKEMGRDPRLAFEGRDLVESADLSLEHLDDLAILVLFSVFESRVRQSVLEAVRGERAALRHESLRRAVEDAIQGIEEGSFFKVIEPFKRQDGDLTEEVNQVRRYRNWVAHGRRNAAPPAVDPLAAYDQLSRFLTLLYPAADETQVEEWVI